MIASRGPRGRRALAGCAAVVLALTLGVAAQAQAAATVTLSSSQHSPVPGEQVTYTGHAVGGVAGDSNYSYQLYDGLEPVGDPQTISYSQDFSYATSYPVTGQHSITLHASEICECPDETGTSPAINENVVAPLSGSISSNPASPTAGQPATLTANVSGGAQPLSYSWDLDGNGTFGDATGASAATTFPTGGDYHPAVRVTDAASPAHTQTISATITVQGPGAPPPPCLKQVAFALALITTNGCLTSTGTATAQQWQTTSAVKLNGLDLPIPAGQRLTISGPTTAAPGGRISLNTARIALGPFTAFSGNIDWKLPAGRQGDEGLVATLSVPAGQKLFGFKVGGSIAMKLGWGANGRHYVTFPVNVQLPDVFKSGPDAQAGGVSGAVAIRVDDTDGVKFDGLKVQVSNAWVGKLKVDQICFSFLPAGSQAVGTCPVPSLGGQPYISCNSNIDTDRWDGNAVLTLPTASKPRLALFGGVAGGQLSKLGGFVDNLGTSVPLVEGVFLTRVGVGLCLNPPPFKLRGDVGVSVLPAGGKSTVGVNGRFLYTDAYNGQPWSLELGGDVTVLGQGLGSGKLILRPTGSIDFDLNASFSLLSIVSVNGDITGWLETSRHTFDIDGTIRACIRSLCAGAEGLVSSTGVAGCLDLGHITYYVLKRNSNWHWYAPWRVHWESREVSFKAGFGHRWASSSVQVFAASCDMGPYHATRSARQVGGGASTFSVPAGTPGLSLQVKGGDAPPKITLVAPSGQRIDSPTEGGVARTPASIIVENPSDGSTDVLLINPVAGTWRVEPADGSTPLSIQTADVEPRSQVVGHAQPIGHGRRKLGISYSIPAGTDLAVVERGPGVERSLVSHVVGHACPQAPKNPAGNITLKCATLTYKPGFGPGGRRRVLAVVSRGGLPVATFAIDRYLEPKPVTPGRARVRVLRRGGKVLIAWSRLAGAARYTISAHVSDGRMLGFDVGGVCSAVTVGNVARSAGVSAKVAGVRPDLQDGPYAAARLKARRAVGGRKVKVPRRSC